MAKVTLNQITKSFDEVPVVRNISLEVADGEFFSLLGPSGCGKTTILRMIAGFTSPSSGKVFFDDKDVTNIPVDQRNTGMVFQNYALFPHLTVFENVAFGLRTRKFSSSEILERVTNSLILVGLGGLEQRPVPQLSGGQQQRVALARAIVIEPDLLLLDEPLSNLDAKLRIETRDQIRELQSQLGITTIYVTHDQEEALAVSDRITVMEKGECCKIDSPDVIYRVPANRFVAKFMGNMNVLTGQTKSKKGNVFFQLANGLNIPLPETTKVLKNPVYLALHPHIIKLSQIEGKDDVEGVVTARQFKGASIEFSIDVNGLSFQVVKNTEESILSIQPGETVWLHIPGDQAIILKS